MTRSQRTVDVMWGSRPGAARSLTSVGVPGGHAAAITHGEGR
jgi:hypothetical protein